MGLYYNRARYYNPAWGRFISEDPTGLRGGVNVYAYANGNPASLTDATGLNPGPGLPPLAAAAAALGIALAAALAPELAGLAAVAVAEGAAEDAAAVGAEALAGAAVDAAGELAAGAAAGAEGAGAAAAVEAAEAAAGAEGVAAAVEAAGAAAEEGVEFRTLRPSGTVAGADAAGAAPNLARLGARFGINADSEVGANILENLNTPVQDFMSQNRLGSIKSVFPS